MVADHGHDVQINRRTGPETGCWGPGALGATAKNRRCPENDQKKIPKILKNIGKF